ncbi:MAG: cbb3-type cytochrome oxidase assembly protein CcoS [Gemmatimonadetes bacterium]|nr:MAG: cbb3-type cytochrome oxidase assembly protein CcoS [Gemmatimonadota bacterium]
MSAIFVMIGASLIVALGFLSAFIWAVRNGQFEDSYTPSIRMLFDDKSTQHPTNPSSKEE